MPLDSAILDYLANSVLCGTSAWHASGCSGLVLAWHMLYGTDWLGPELKSLCTLIGDNSLSLCDVVDIELYVAFQGV